MLLCWGESLEGLWIQMSTFMVLRVLDNGELGGGWDLLRALDRFFSVEGGFWGEEEFQRLLALLSFAEMAAVMVLLYCRC